MPPLSLKNSVLLVAFLFTSIWIYFNHSKPERYRVPPLNSFDLHPSTSFIQCPHAQCPFTALPYWDGDERPVEYARAIIRPRLRPVRRPTITNIEEGPFLPPFSPFGSDSKHAPYPSTCLNTPIAIFDVAPDPPPTHEVTHVLFGIATDIDRLHESHQSLKHFISPSLNTSLLALVPPSSGISTQERTLRAAGLPVTLHPTPLNYTARYFSLIPALARHLATNPDLPPDTTFLSLLDDDTFLPSLSHLKHRLSLLRPGAHYIGAPSEALHQRLNFGNQAFGGAGILLSPQLISILSDPRNYDTCVSEKIGPDSMPGDQRLARCIEKVASRVKLKHWPELRQWDLRGDPRGVFESGKPIWSFHHLTGREGWLGFDLLGMAAVKDVAGEEAVLRRWAFDKKVNVRGERETWVLTNGYSIVRYVMEKGCADVDFTKTEKSWIEGANGYDKSLGPLRVAAGEVEGLKVDRWRLRRAEMKDGNVHQVYWRDLDGEQGPGKGGGSAIELVWLGEKMDRLSGLESAFDNSSG